MRGHEPLIAMRLKGKKPRSVSLTVGRLAQWVLDWHQRPETCGDADIEVESKDNPTTMDLRFVVGLDVLVYGPHGSRTQAVVDACTKAGAKRVIGAQVKDFERGGYDMELTDTEAAHG